MSAPICIERVLRILGVNFLLMCIEAGMNTNLESCLKWKKNSCAIFLIDNGRGFDAVSCFYYYVRRSGADVRNQYGVSLRLGRVLS